LLNCAAATDRLIESAVGPPPGCRPVVNILGTGYTIENNHTERERMAPKIGFIGIIREELSQDPDGTLKWVADLGFDGMEGAASLSQTLGISVAQTRAKLDSLGLAVPVQGRVSFGQSDDEIRAVIATARDIGAPYVVDYFAPFKSKDEILEYAEFYTRAGKLCADEGLRFLYHNHNHEMRKHDGQLGIDIFLANTDPELVNVELDIGWVAFGGVDPAALIEQHPNRFPVLHMKDFESLPSDDKDPKDQRKQATFAEVGTGAVDMKSVVEVAKKVGIEWLNIEQDRMNKRTPKESLETSFKNLKALVG
jgi:sugar phosphate isomerase/epimerase